MAASVPTIMRRKHTKLGNLVGRPLTALLIVLLSTSSLHGSKISGSTLAPATNSNKISPKASSKIAPDLLQEILSVAPTTRIDVIVQYKRIPGQEQYDNLAQQGGKIHRKLHSIKSAALSLPAGAILQLANRSDVQYISGDRPVAMSLDYVSKAVNADIAWSYGLDGTGVGIAVIDSGVYSHPDLNTADATASRIIYSESFVPNDATTDDAYGHGTHVAGIATGDGQSSVSGYKGEYRGIAPNANIINLRVLDANGRGTDSGVVAAIQRAIQLQAQYNIRIINLSLGRRVFESYTLDPLCQAVEQAWKAGIVVVVAAGNYGRDNSLGTHGYASIAAPGNDPYVITVGATNMMKTYNRADDTIASYSSKGPSLIDHVVKPDLVAPGNLVVSLGDLGATLETEHPNLNIFPCNAYGWCNSTVGPAQYFRLSGTSMATPVVSGAAALMIQRDPTLTPDLIKARMMKTAYKLFSNYSVGVDKYGYSYASQSDLFTYGAGYLDIAAALNNTDGGPGLALSPYVVYNPLTHTVSLSYDQTLLGGTSVLWGTSVVWGTSLVWGTNVFVGGSSVLWGSSVVWGTDTSSAFSVVWGTSVIWGTSDTSAFSVDDGDCPIDPVTGLAVCE